MTEVYLQTLGWVGNCGFVVAAYLLTQKRLKWYAALNILGNAAYCVQAMVYRNWSLVVLSLVLGMLSAMLLRKGKQSASSTSV